MDATLKKMFTLRETRDVDLAALKDPGPRHRDVQEAAGTLGNRDLSRRIKARYKAAAKARHLRKGVRLAALKFARESTGGYGCGVAVDY
jgi:hypothetical protein